MRNKRGDAGNVRATEREVLNYNAALQQIQQLTQDYSWALSLDFLLNIHKIVTNGLLPAFQSGRLRTEAVIVYEPISREIATAK